jgi:hypothetical protein
MTASVVERASFLSAMPTRADIYRLETLLQSGPTVDVDSRTEHTFGPGFYCRTLRLAAGETATGKVHATEHVFLLTAGELLLVDEGGRRHLTAPAQFVSGGGIKRAAHALTDVVCTNVHITTETDLDKLEALLIEPPEVLKVEG